MSEGFVYGLFFRGGDLKEEEDEVVGFISDTETLDRIYTDLDAAIEYAEGKYHPANRYTYFGEEARKYLEKCEEELDIEIIEDGPGEFIHASATSCGVLGLPSAWIIRKIPITDW